MLLRLARRKTSVKGKVEENVMKYLLEQNIFGMLWAMQQKVECVENDQIEVFHHAVRR